MDSVWRMFDWKEREFDEYNFLQKEVMYTTDYSTMISDTNDIVEYAYDSLGYLMMRTDLSQFEGHWDPYEAVNYTYDEHQNLVYEIYFDRDYYLYYYQDSVVMIGQGGYHYIYDFQEDHNDLFVDEILSVSIYPNPFSDYIHFFVQTNELGILQLNIYDMHGRQIYSDLLQIMDNNFVSTVWLDQLPANQMYFYSIISDQSVLTGKIIKE
jgi:hypothetical protein